MLCLSKHTHNSVAEMLKMPFETVKSMYNALISIVEQENEHTKKQQQDAMGGNNGLTKNPMGNISSMSSNMMSQARNMMSNATSNFKMPNFGGFHL